MRGITLANVSEVGIQPKFNREGRTMIKPVLGELAGLTGFMALNLIFLANPFAVFH